MRLVDADVLKHDIKVKRDYTDTTTAVGRGEYIAINKVLTMVDEQPTITPDMAQVLAYECGKAERKNGRWIPIVKGERGYSAGDFRCSVCGDPCKCYHLTNYCPSCGADMRKGEEE